IAYLLDRNEFARTFTGGFGTTTHASYGLAQWMVEEAEDEIGALNTYSKNLDAAIAELEAGGWVLDKDGNEYTSGLRYKKLDDGTLMPLTIKWGSSENNPVADLLVTMLANGSDTATAGMEIKQTIMTFSELMENLNGLKENDYNMYNLATNYYTTFDPEASYEIGGVANVNHIADEELAKLAFDLAKVPNGDDEAYLAKW
ncbi:MAG: ABC transporter substrate-binding protein, partial [Lachnospiraceae bacterium]|nr:ABC transporter substrate-binding protein [Lachnospiraceae bacterium]